MFAGWTPFPPEKSMVSVLITAGVGTLAMVAFLIWGSGVDRLFWMSLWLSMIVVPCVVGTFAWLRRPLYDLPGGASALAVLSGVLHGLVWCLVWRPWVGYTALWYGAGMAVIGGGTAFWRVARLPHGGRGRPRDRTGQTPPAPNS